LEYVVQQTLEGRAADIKEYTIGVDVFERGADFDPKADSIVRYEARRLRAKLHEYYAGAGANDPVIIHLPKGGYVPEFEWKEGPPATAVTKPRQWSLDWRWSAACGALALLAVAAGIAWWRSHQPAPTPSVFVLPFVNPDATTRYLSDGLREEIQEGLARISGLRVLVNAPSGMNLNGVTDYRSLGRKLGVVTILSGEFSHQRSSLSVRYRLVRTADGSLLAAGSRAAPNGALTGIDTGIVSETARALHLRTPAMEPSTGSQEANDLYMRARYLWHTRDAPKVFEAIGLYQRALQIDPNYAAPYTGLADAYVMEVINQNVDPATGVTKGMAAATEALARDPDSADAHTALGLLFYAQWKWADAEREFRTALRLDPNYGILWERMALLAYALGRFEESENYFEKAREVDPFTLFIPETEAQLYYYWRRPDKVIALCRLINTLSPGDTECHECLAYAYLEKGDFAAAYHEYELFMRALPVPNNLGGQAVELAFLARLKGRPAAVPVFAQIEEQVAKGAYASRLGLAAGALAVGDRRKALRYLHEAYDLRFPDLLSTRFDPLFDELHGDAEFEKIFRDMGVTDSR
jgi:tetratricopeptide (TPR) repeat protein/TolB-like protein